MGDIRSLTTAMVEYYSGDPKRIQHFIKVHSFAQMIGQLEGLDSDTQFLLETAALVHDIGIKNAEAKYDSSAGRFQETEGPPVARRLLEELGFAPEVIERVCFLVGHHHTYSAIDGIDFQILVEADFLVNIYEDDISPDGAQNAYRTIFRTDTGRQLCRVMFQVRE